MVTYFFDAEKLCVTLPCRADLWTGTFAHTRLKSNASNIHLFNNRRRFRAARAAFHAGFVPLVPRSAPVSCRSCRFPRRFRAACAARAAFRAGFVPLVPLSTSVSCRLCRSCLVCRQTDRCHMAQKLLQRGVLLTEHQQKDWQ